MCLFDDNSPVSDVWSGLDKLQQEDPESYSRILKESAQWQENANSVPEPGKASTQYQILNHFKVYLRTANRSNLHICHLIFTVREMF